MSVRRGRVHSRTHRSTCRSRLCLYRCVHSLHSSVHTHSRWYILCRSLGAPWCSCDRSTVSLHQGLACRRSRLCLQRWDTLPALIHGSHAQYFLRSTSNRSSD
ncbi:hypothetical protein NP493_369g05028 [Ridgeia piscesae]|uniref:Uncharacterized protein n=1 Tax=Ridgeia piscesae TaxID=27915 RepID=A0AAD9L315_RIDPI|nr:hypothetical protein NP493_369g05028 [Ridgeia piscesae]